MSGCSAILTAWNSSSWKVRQLRAGRCDHGHRHDQSPAYTAANARMSALSATSTGWKRWSAGTRCSAYLVGEAWVLNQVPFKQPPVPVNQCRSRHGRSGHQP